MSMGCVDTKDIRVETLVLPEAVARCAVKLRNEFDLGTMDPTVCLYIGEAECALQKPFSKFCPAANTSACNAYEGWTYAPDCSPVIGGIEPGEKLPVKVQLIRSDVCPRSPMPECSAASGSVDEKKCALGFAYEYESDETGALVPQETESLELWYSALFSDEHQLGADDLPVLCPGLNLREGGERVTVNLTIAMRQGSRELPAGTLSVSPYPALAACSWPSSTKLSHECESFTLATGGEAPIKLTPKLTERDVTPTSWLGCVKPEGVQGGQRCVLELLGVSGLGNMPPPAINLTAIFAGP